ncbi:probable UDP-sugar transporter protein SLC35A4 [Mobula hypostoma]|uniref:probable UDP-sugar transporter protein SLC35A4 n=1 Tax=Mobula hypostoma TaxID=723540 RepID=UPI002FC2EB52
MELWEDATATNRGRLRGQLYWALALLVSALAYGSHAPLLTLCKVGLEVPFSSSSVVVLTELVKLCASAVGLLLPRRHSPPVPLSPSASLMAAVPFALPAALYAINNNLAVHMQQQMDPVTFQVLGNLKIVATATFCGLLLRRRLSPRRWLALLLLTAAGACHAGSVRRHDDRESLGPLRPYLTPLGATYCALYCTVSGLSAACTEWALKSRPLPLSLQNFFLYAFGVAANAAAHLASSPADAGFFQGFSPWVALIVASQALNGLLMSAIMKYGSGITRLFVISCSMLVNAGLSVILFSMELTPLFYVAAALICVAIHLYYNIG